MSPTIVLVTAAVIGITAVVLTPSMRHLAGTDSGWLRSGLHSVLAGLGAAGAATLAHGWAELTAFAVLALAAGLLVVIDLAVYRLPDVIVAPTYLVLFAALTVAAATRADWDRLGRAAGASGILALGYLALALVTPSGLGLGDVKLAGLLGVFLGWLGWQQTIIGTLAAFVLSGAVAVVLLLSTSATGRTAFPFGPCMVAGAAIGAAWGPTLIAGSG
jgi:leader peptidase (prepilin peptidase)/N-methyltransferase